jgi:hypothetical protein
MWAPSRKTGSRPEALQVSAKSRHSSGRIIHHQDPIRPRLGTGPGKALGPHGLDGIGVAHQHDRRLIAGRTEAAHNIKHLAHAHTGRQGTLGSTLDGGAIGHGVGKRHAELDDVGPPATSACISGRVISGAGSPAVMKGISALRPSLSSRLKVCWILDMDGYQWSAALPGNPARAAKIRTGCRTSRQRYACPCRRDRTDSPAGPCPSGGSGRAWRHRPGRGTTPAPE